MYDDLQSADPGSDLLLGSASSVVIPAALSPAPPANWLCPLSEITVTIETNTPTPPETDPAPSVASQLLAPPPATCQSQLIIVERRGHVLPGEHVVSDASVTAGFRFTVLYLSFFPFR